MYKNKYLKYQNKLFGGAVNNKINININLKPSGQILINLKII